MAVSNKKERIEKLLKSRKFIIGAVLAILVVAAALLFGLRWLSPATNTDAQAPALQIGKTEVSAEQYTKLVKEAETKKVAEVDAKAQINEAYRLKEVARQLGLSVPEWLPAAQAADGPASSSDLSDFEKLSLYTGAFYTIVALVEDGGSLSTVFYAPYDASSNVAENEKYASAKANNVKTYTANGVVDGEDKKISDPIRAYLAFFARDQRLNYKEGANQSRVAALTSDGRLVSPLTEDELANLSQDELLTSGNVRYSNFDTDVFTLIKTAEKGKLSSVTKLAAQNAYVVIHKDELYAKDADIRTKVQGTLLTLQVGEDK